MCPKERRYPGDGVWETSSSLWAVGLGTHYQFYFSLLLDRRLNHLYIQGFCAKFLLIALRLGNEGKYLLKRVHMM